MRIYPKALLGNKWRTILESTASGVRWSSAQAIVDDKKVASNVKRCHLLILDDLGKESSFESAQAIIRDVISKRYDDELPVIVATELTVTDIEGRYGRAIAERIVGEPDDGGRFITCGDASMRLANE